MCLRGMKLSLPSNVGAPSACLSQRGPPPGYPHAGLRTALEAGTSRLIHRLGNQLRHISLLNRRSILQAAIEPK